MEKGHALHPWSMLSMHLSEDRTGCRSVPNGSRTAALCLFRRVRKRAQLPVVGLGAQWTRPYLHTHSRRGKPHAMYRAREQSSANRVHKPFCLSLGVEFVGFDDTTLRLAAHTTIKDPTYMQRAGKRPVGLTALLTSQGSLDSFNVLPRVYRSTSSFCLFAITIAYTSAICTRS